MFILTDYFSFYVFVWFIFYKLNMIPYNPIIIFYLILGFVLWMLSYMIYLKISIKKISDDDVINKFIFDNINYYF